MWFFWGLSWILSVFGKACLLWIVRILVLPAPCNLHTLYQPTASKVLFSISFPGISSSQHVSIWPKTSGYHDADFSEASFLDSSTLFSSLLDQFWLPQQALGEGNGTPLQYSCLENPMDGGAWWAVVHGVTKSWTQLSNFTFTFHFHALEKEMATHSRVLAWRIPGTGEPGGLPSMGSHRVGHDWSDLAAAASPSFSLLLLSTLSLSCSPWALPPCA